MGMTTNKLRCGNFTSSEIVALTTKDRKGTGPGAPFLTYVNETNMERRLQRSLTTEVDAKPLTWGKLLEPRVFDMLGLEYTLTSDETFQHPEIPYWVGSPDGLKPANAALMDIKCPFTLKSFCNLVDPLYEGLTGIHAMNEIRERHKDGDKYYWQLVSNAIIKNMDYAELIVYMPYFFELADIRMMAQNLPGDQLGNLYWLTMSQDDQLPYLPDGGYYKNLNVIRFEIPQEDKKFLTERVKQAGAMLINNPSVVIASADKEVSATIVEDPNALKI